IFSGTSDESTPSSDDRKKGIRCFSPRDEGHCQNTNGKNNNTKPVLQYYFDSETSCCKPFVYMGCGGNGNRFQNETECAMTCKRRSPDGSTDPPNYVDESMEADIEVFRLRCLQERDLGRCCRQANKRAWRYYYDSYRQECRLFHFAGCGGNANNYRGYEECVQACNQSKLRALLRRSQRDARVLGLQQDLNKGVSSSPTRKSKRTCHSSTISESRQGTESPPDNRTQYLAWLGLRQTRSTDSNGPSGKTTGNAGLQNIRQEHAAQQSVGHLQRHVWQKETGAHGFLTPLFSSCHPPPPLPPRPLDGTEGPKSSESRDHGDSSTNRKDNKTSGKSRDPGNKYSSAETDEPNKNTSDRGLTSLPPTSPIEESNEKKNSSKDLIPNPPTVEEPEGTENGKQPTTQSSADGAGGISDVSSSEGQDGHDSQGHQPSDDPPGSPEKETPGGGTAECTNGGPRATTEKRNSTSPEVFVKFCREIPEDGVHCELEQHDGYYYDGEKEPRECRKYTFLGCESGNNHFETLKECNDYCNKRRYRNYTSFYQLPWTTKSMCLAPPDTGMPCKKAQSRHTLSYFYYNSSAKTCMPLKYAGCGGNRNKYRTLEECKSWCSGVEFSEYTERYKEIKT
ncbi:unnamed protein product, partial [Ixodes hexagonus]